SRDWSSDVCSSDLEGIARMQHQRDAHGLPGAAGQVGAVGAGGRRQFGALHMAEQHCRPFEHGPVFEVTAQAATAFGAGPGVAAERRAAYVLERLNNIGLQAGKEFTRLFLVNAHAPPEPGLPPPLEADAAAAWGSARQPISRRYCCPSKWVRVIAS